MGYSLQPHIRRSRLPSKPHTRLRQVSEAGLRFYNPGLGRWISGDPLGEESGLNLYGFINSDGINNLDALGFGIIKIPPPSPNPPPALPPPTLSPPSFSPVRWTYCLSMCSMDAAYSELEESVETFEVCKRTALACGNDSFGDPVDLFNLTLISTSGTWKNGLTCTYKCLTSMKGLLPSGPPTVKVGRPRAMCDKGRTAAEQRVIVQLNYSVTFPPPPGGTGGFTANRIKYVDCPYSTYCTCGCKPGSTSPLF